MRNDLDPIELEALARAHKHQVLDTYKLYGQCDGIDQPEESDHLPLSGVHTWFDRAHRTSAPSLTFDVLVIACVAFLLVVLTRLTGSMT